MTRWLYLALAFTFLAVAGTAYVWFFQYDQLPERVPVHWNIHNEPDGWTERANAWHYLILMPAVMVGMILLTLAIPWLSPKNFEVDSFRNTYGYIMALAVGLMGFMQVPIVMGTFGNQMPFGKMIIGGVFFFFALMGNVLGKVRRNFWMGVRTPWTLASDAVWNQTHRVTAWIFVVFGTLSPIVLLLVPGDTVVLWVVGAFLPVVFFPIIYSLVLYKRLERQGKL
jgi:uncharacterized membrane protein